MLLKVVVLYLLTANADTGQILFHKKWALDGFAVSGNQIEYCRTEGVRMAHQLSDYYRQWYPNATTNVDCQWESVKK